MTQFDEAKHNRASDGKFANKPHAEADSVNLATQGSVAPQPSQRTSKQSGSTWNAPPAPI